MQITLQNPQASTPLQVNVSLECNTKKEVAFAHALENARKVKRWVQEQPAHERVAVLVGSGPSVLRDMQELHAQTRQGRDIFALNNAANLLSRVGIRPGYQIIMDAQIATRSLIGPAREYLFASQVHPSLVDAVGRDRVLLWHATYGAELPDEQPGFPEYDGDYCLIGGAVSVGNTALGLLYAMGYRAIHIYGMDSSNERGKSHALHQAINDGEPCTMVVFGGKQYTSSFTMKEQADTFMRRAGLLASVGVSIEVHGDGLLPDMWRAQRDESQIYTTLWDSAEYRETSPGEHEAKTFVEIARPSKEATIVDFGCGTGRGALEIQRLTGIDHGNFTLVDFTENSRDEAAQVFPFVKADITQPLEIAADFGFCVDVLEHVHPTDVGAVLRNIAQACRESFIQVSLVPDVMGEKLGLTLHLTVRPVGWWTEQLISNGLSIKWAMVNSTTAAFYCERV